MRVSDYTLRNLRTFCAVVEHGGYGGAQAIIGAGQSVISTHMRDLETTLGFSLCQRGRAGFALTEKGRRSTARQSACLPRWMIAKPIWVRFGRS